MISTKKSIAITCGDPAGVGPEVAFKAWSHLKDQIPMFWIGDPKHLPAETSYKLIDHPSDIVGKPQDQLCVYPLSFRGPRNYGRSNPDHATSIIKSIEIAVGFAQRQEVGAICTAPIQKSALITGANFPYPGHTEFLASLSGVKHVVMMLACKDLKAVPTTIHIPLHDVKKHLTKDLLEQTIKITHSALIQHFGISNPRIAISGLNPHAGEDGKMGTEEQTLIAPVLDTLKDQGLTLLGPLPADTMFHASARAQYDVAICMYHDQALIPVKTLDFAGGVNVTLGLPFVRTSPDHGTAYNIAGQNCADPTSMIEAIKLAYDMSPSQ